MTQTTSQLQNSSEEIKEGKIYKQWFFAIILNIAALNFGLQVGWPSAVSNVLQSEKSPTGHPLSTIDISWIASSPNLSAMISIPLWTYLVDKYGRKPLLIVCEVILTIAARTIASMRCLEVNDKSVQVAIASIKAEDDKFKSIPNINFFGIFRQKAWRNGFVFMLLVMFCHGLNGGYAIANYAPHIMRMFGVTINPELQSISIPIFMMVGCGLSMFFIEYLGRKVILALSFFLCLLAFIALSAIVMIQQHGGYVPGWVAVLITVMTVCMYAAAVSPIPFVIMVEMFNFQIRAKMMGCLGIVGWGSVFVQILIFGPMSATFGAHATFLFYACVNLCGVVVVLVLLPETKRKSVEEIERELENKFG